VTVITLDRVSKRFKQTIEDEPAQIVAAEDISLKIADGEVLALLGPSGCGKTTVLRMIAGLEKPDSGQVMFDGVPLAEVPPEDRGIGMVFQDKALIPHWESRRNIGFFLELRKREDELPERIRRISQITGVGIEQILDRRPGQLSGGEQQRVAIARALARDLRLLLFDEPFSNLDAKLRASARVELKRLLQEFPTTTVYVTHDQLEAVALADRIAVMREGRLEQIGPHRLLYDMPINLFVATFIGVPTINLFEGQAHGGLWQGGGFGGFPLRSDLPDGTPVTLGVRPEFIHLAPEGVQAVITHASPFFPERHWLVDVEAGAERWSLQVPLEEHVEPGAKVACAFDPAGLLFFDTRTGRRIG
jgi:multiple sugar transport system ATP-binding protein